MTWICDVLPRLLREHGLITRVDARSGDPVVQLCPPLVAGPEEFEAIAASLRHSLEELAETLAAENRQCWRGAP